MNGWRNRWEQASTWRVGRVVSSVVVVAIVTACGGGSDDTAGDSDGASSRDGDDGVQSIDADVPIDELGAALADVESVDRRPAVLSELGGPDAFVITVDEVDGTVSRFESWSYFGAATQIDFVDGELLWDIEIGGLPDGTLLPLMYEPMEFTMLASVDDTLAALSGVDLQSVAAAADFEVEGAELWAGEQLALAFVADQLIYVETFPLAPGDQEVVE